MLPTLPDAMCARVPCRWGCVKGLLQHRYMRPGGPFLGGYLPRKLFPGQSLPLGACYQTVMFRQDSRTGRGTVSGHPGGTTVRDSNITPVPGRVSVAHPVK